MQQIAVSIVSNSRLLSEGLIELLAARIDLRVLAIYPSDPLATMQLASPPGHVVLLDGNIGRVAARAWTHYWRRITPPANVVILELSDDIELILACIEAGASGYTLRGATPDEVATMICLVAQGQARCSPEITAHLFRRLASIRATGGPVYSSGIPLTTRELQVLELVAQNYSNKEIASELCITLRTVKQHVHNILNKLKLKHRYEATHVAIKQGWLRHDGP